MRKQRHHVITRQHCKRYGVPQDDPRNIVEIEGTRHYAHHRALPKLSVSVLPVETVRWIEGQDLGWYLARYYDDYEGAA